MKGMNYIMIIGKYKKPGIIVILLAMIFLLSGCMKMHINIIWNEDNTGLVEMTMGIDSSMLSMMGASEDDIRSELSGSMSEEGFTISDYSDDKYVGIIATMQIDDVTKGVGDSAGDLSFRFSEDGGVKTYTVSGRIDNSDMMGDASGMEEMGMSMDDIDMDIKFTITMPGKIVSHNATEQKGNTLIWDITSGSASIQATSEAGGSDFMSILMWILFGVGIVMFLGAVLIIIMKAGKKS